MKLILIDVITDRILKKLIFFKIQKNYLFLNVQVQNTMFKSLYLRSLSTLSKMYFQNNKNHQTLISLCENNTQCSITNSN